MKYGGIYFTGDKNITNSGSLDYLVNAISEKLFGVEPYPSLFDRAAAYTYFIIRDHIFHDGNKRTGTAASILFLKRNGIRLKSIVSQNAIVNLAIKVVKGEYNKNDISKWFREHSERINLDYHIPEE